MTVNKLSAGSLWKEVKSYLTDNLRFGEYTLNIPQNATITTIQAPVLINGNYVGGLYQEARSGAVMPFEDYLATIPFESSIKSSAVFNFQLVMRLSGKNSYSTLSDAIAIATDIANDVLLVTYSNFTAIHPCIRGIEGIEHNPVGITRADGKIDGDWLIVIAPKFKIIWLPDYSEGVHTDDYYIPPSIIDVGIFVAKNNNLTDRVLDATVRVAIDS